jgi:CO dehydrogenase maturation factor
MKALIAERTGTGRDAIGTYFKLNPKVNDLPEEHWLETGSVKLLVLGGMTRAGGGCACPEGAFLKALLTNTILARDELVLVDLAAGVEFMGRASVQGIDAFVVVVEPGSRSIETANSLAAMARELGISRVGAVANKITDPAQAELIASQLTGTPLLGAISYSLSAQEADLRRTPVVSAGGTLVRELDEARQRLLDLVCVPSETSGRR